MNVGGYGKGPASLLRSYAVAFFFSAGGHTVDEEGKSPASLLRSYAAAFFSPAQQAGEKNGDPNGI